MSTVWKWIVEYIVIGILNLIFGEIIDRIRNEQDERRRRRIDDAMRRAEDENEVEDLQDELGNLV